MTRVLAVANQKGGVGKTTTTVNLAAGLALAGKRVLLVDLDPQGNATMGSGVDKRALKQTVYHVLLGLATTDSVRAYSESGGYDVLPANRDLAGAEVEMVELEHRELRLKSALARIASQYDFILIDCPPALNLLTLNGLVAADSVMIPMQCEYYALEGLSDLINTIKKVRVQLNPKIEIEGLLRTMFDPRNTLALQVSSQLEQHFGKKVYDTVIPRNVRLAEAPSYGIPAVKFDVMCKGSQAYVELANEILGRADAGATAVVAGEEGGMIKQKGLGRGLDALLDAESAPPAAESLGTARVEHLRPGRYQPRTRMDAESLNELAASIKEQGLIQPILVRPAGADRFEIIAGERRWRAAQIAGLEEVPVVVRDVPDQAALAMALIENIQREDLNPLEEAQGVQRLVAEFKLTHQEAADAIGRSRAATTNLLRLLNLPQAVQQLVLDGALDMGHARALLALDGALQVGTAKKVAAKGLSVRETEQLVNDILHPQARQARVKARTGRDIQRLEEEVSGKLGTTVEIKAGKKGSGRLVVNYMSNEHLDELLQKLTR